MPQPIDNLRIRLFSVGNAVIDTAAPTLGDYALSPADLKIQYGVSVVVNRPESRVDVKVSMSYLSDQTALFSGGLTTSFDVVELSSFISTKEGEDGFRIENDFLPMLINIAFGTTRGYFARELQGSVLAPYPFPMVSMEGIQKRTTYRLI